MGCQGAVHWSHRTGGALGTPTCAVTSLLQRAPGASPFLGTQFLQGLSQHAVGNPKHPLPLYDRPGGAGTGEAATSHHIRTPGWSSASLLHCLHTLLPAGGPGRQPPATHREDPRRSSRASPPQPALGVWGVNQQNRERSLSFPLSFSLPLKCTNL